MKNVTPINKCSISSIKNCHSVYIMNVVFKGANHKGVISSYYTSNLLSYLQK